MKLYTITNKSGKTLAFAGTQGDARAKKKELGGQSWQECEVPTRKEDLLEFLNTHAVAKPE